MDSTVASSEDIFWDSLGVLDNQHWISSNLKGSGELQFSGALRFGGEWSGLIESVKPDSHLYVMSGAKIQGKLRVSEISVEGNLENIEIEAEVLRVLSGSKVRGVIRAAKLIVEDGAVVEGSIKSGTPVEV